MRSQQTFKNLTIPKNNDKVQYKQIKQAKKKQKISDKYKQQCRNTLKRDPPTYITNNFIKQREKYLVIDLQLIQSDDLIFIYELFKMPIIKIIIHLTKQKQKKKQQNFHIAQFHETNKFNQLLREVGGALSTNSSIKSLQFDNIPLTCLHLKIIGPYIAKSLYIRQLSITNCQMKDQQLDAIKMPLSKNQSLAILNLSGNYLGSESGAMLGKILSEHSVRRDEIVWMASLRSQEIDLEQQPSMKGLCQINLSNNKLDDISVNGMIQYLKNDQWTRCINLKTNKIQKQGIKQFAMLMKKNLTIISLDLRQNPGFNRRYSKYIINKLKQNLQRYKEYKQQLHTTIKNNKQLKIKAPKNKQDKHRSMQQSRRKSIQQKNNHLQFSIANNTLEAVPMTKQNGGSRSMIQYCDHGCHVCKLKTMQVLKLQKKNLDLQLELKRLRNVLLRNNVDANISAIQPQNNQQHHQSNIAFQSFHRITGSHPESDQQLIMKVQQIMMQLTKIMQNIDAQQNSQINISNNFSNANSLSNTIPLFSKPGQLEQEFGINDNLNEEIESPVRVLNSPHDQNSHDQTS